VRWYCGALAAQRATNFQVFENAEAAELIGGLREAWLEASEANHLAFAIL